MQRGAPAFICTLVLSLFLVLASTPATGWHVDPAPPLLHSGGGPGSGWVMYKFDPAEDRVVIDLEVPVVQGDHAVIQLAAIEYDAELNSRFGFAFTAFWGNDGIHVSTDQIGDDGTTIDTYPEVTGGGAALGLDINNPEYGEPQSGTRYLALWVAGSVGAHTHAFHGGPDVDLMAVESDDTAFLYTTTDFEGPLTARVSSGPVAARALLDGHIDREIEGNLVGIFSGGYPAADVLEVDRPDGTTESCFCFWTKVDGPGAHPAGSYTFRATGASASVTGLDQVTLGGADLRIPE